MARYTVNRWQPDTCGCVLHYRFDADEPAETRVHTPVEMGDDRVPSVKCALHADAADWQSHFDAVQAHNRSRGAARV